MKIASSLMNWLTQAPAYARPQDSSAPGPAQKQSPAAQPQTRDTPPAIDKVAFSDAALQMSHQSEEGSDAQISAEEKEALNQQFQSSTYKVSIAQIAKRFLSGGLF